MNRARQADPPLLIGLAVFATATLLAFASTLQAGIWLGHGRASGIPWQGLLRARLVDWYCYALFFPLLLALARRAPLAGRRWARAAIIYVSAAAALALAKEALFVTIGNWFRPGVFDLPQILAEDYCSEVLTFWALIAASHAVHYRPRHEQAPVSPPAPELLERFTVRDRDLLRLVPAEQVVWIEAEGNYVRLHTDGARFLVRATMADLERRLGEQFVRVHRGAILNSERVQGIERRPGGRYAVLLEGGSVIVSGRAFAAAVRKLAS